MSPGLQNRANARTSSYVGIDANSDALYPHPLNDMRNIRTAFSTNRSKFKSDLTEPFSGFPASAKLSRDKYARLEKVRENLLEEAKSA